MGFSLQSILKMLVFDVTIPEVFWEWFNCMEEAACYWHLGAAKKTRPRKYPQPLLCFNSFPLLEIVLKSLSFFSGGPVHDWHVTVLVNLIKSVTLLYHLIPRFCNKTWVVKSGYKYPAQQYPIARLHMKTESDSALLTKFKCIYWELDFI